MSEVDKIIEGIFTLFIVLLLGYIFVNVFWILSPSLAILFAFLVAIILIGILLQILRR